MKTVVEHLSNLIRIPSVSSVSNRPVIEYARKLLCEAQWQTREMIYRDATGFEKINLIASPPGQDIDGPAELVFVCHTDTVPYAADWTNALTPFVADGLLHGCGACDVKGFLACLLTAIGASDPLRLLMGLRLVLTADEEIGCVGASRLIAAESIKPRKVVIGEPTSLHPARTGKGYCLAEITVFGDEAHSAYPKKGRSAIYGAARLISAIEAFAAQLGEEKHALFAPDFTTLNVGTIRGGIAKNIVPGQCSFQLEWRSIPGQSLDTVPAAVSKIAEELRSVDPDFRYQINLLRQQAGFETSAAAPLVRGMERSTGRPATSIPFGSEASLFATIAEEVIVFGPGDMETAHSDRECVPLKELDEAIACLRAMMMTN
jgi:acetylornithine deacetylase